MSITRMIRHNNNYSFLFLSLCLIASFNIIPLAEGALNKNKVILIGADGLTEDVINQLINQGKLRNIQYLREHGSYGRIISIDKTVSPALWTSIATGKKREDHGIIGFEMEDRAGKRILLNRSHRKTKALWNILSENGMRVGSIGYFTTWPVEKINGFMISDNSIFPIDQCYYPHTVEGIMRDVLSPYIKYDPNQLGKFDQLSLEEQCQYFSPKMFNYLDQLGSGLINNYPLIKNKKIYSQVEWEQYREFFKHNEIVAEVVFKASFIDHIKFEYAKRMYSRDLNFFTLYLKGPDIVSHHNWGYYEPTSDIPKTDIAAFKDIIPNYYMFIDEVVGYFRQVMDPDTVIILVADHGFKKCHKRLIFNINKIIATTGYLGYGPDGRIRKDLMFDDKITFWQDKKDRDIYVNLNVLFPNLDPNQDDTKMRQIADRLADVKVNNNKLFKQINYFPQQYPGVYRIQATISDELHTGRNDCLPPCAQMEGTITIGKSSYPLSQYLEFSVLEGQHDTYDGSFYFMGPIIKAKNLIQGFSILDITPAILEILELPIGADMSGGVPISVFNPEFLIQHPPRFIESYDKTKIPLSKTAPKESSVDDKIKKQLRSLGYIQ